MTYLLHPTPLATWWQSSMRCCEGGVTTFARGNSAKKFSQIDAYVWERLALFDSKKRQHAGRRWGEEHAYAWATGLGVYRLSGTIRYTQSATVRT
jgi:hypothetical protein